MRAIGRTLAALLIPAALVGQRGPGACCAGPPVELKGQVSQVRITPGEGMPFLTVDTGREKARVLLGAMRFLITQGFDPKVGEEVAVKAFKAGADYIAQTVTLTARNKTIRLRDENGMPLWRGGRWGPAR